MSDGGHILLNFGDRAEVMYVHLDALAAEVRHGRVWKLVLGAAQEAMAAVAAPAHRPRVLWCHIGDGMNKFGNPITALFLYFSRCARGSREHVPLADAVMRKLGKVTPIGASWLPAEAKPVLACRGGEFLIPKAPGSQVHQLLHEGGAWRLGHGNEAVLKFPVVPYRVYFDPTWSKKLT